MKKGFQGKAARVRAGADGLQPPRDERGAEGAPPDALHRTP